MAWGLLLLFLAAVYGVGVSFYLLNKYDKLKHLPLFLASVTFLLVSLANLADIITVGPTIKAIVNQIREWGYIYTIVLVLGNLLLFVRESKPQFSKFPLFFAGLPVILLISYLLVYNTPVLKWWVLRTAEAGAVVSAILIYGLYTYQKNRYKTTFAGCILFFITFITSLFIPDSLQLVLQVLGFLSISTVFSGFLIVDKHNTPKKGK